MALVLKISDGNLFEMKERKKIIKINKINKTNKQGQRQFVVSRHFVPFDQIFAAFEESFVLQ